MNFYNSSILVVLSFAIYLYWYFKKTFKFFEKHGIPYVKGNMTLRSFRKPLADVHRDLYRELEPHKFGGVFNMMKPNIIVRDPKLIKQILIRDFSFFSDRGIDIDENTDPLAHHLFTMKGDDWKNLRIKLTTIFTSGKMKMMFPLLITCGKNLHKIIDDLPYDESFDAKDLFARYTSDAIGSCAFGLETGSLENPNSEFRMMGKKFSEFRIKSLIRVLLPIPSRLAKLLDLTLIDSNLQKYFKDMVDTTVKYREKNNITRNDFLDLMIALKNNTMLQKFQDTGDLEDLQKLLEQIGDKFVKSDVVMTNVSLAAQALLFFGAGSDTASTTLAYALLELSLNPAMQDKLRQEINHVLATNDDQFTYEAMKQTKYMDMVIAETLRKYPPAPTLMRKSNENYKILNTNIIIPAGTSITIPIFGIHSDEKYYDNPEEFRPERFTKEEVAKRMNYTYLPFGGGPRVCIAERFAKIKVKIAMVYALKDFSYRVSPQMKLPVEFEKNYGTTGPRDGVHLIKQRL
uniref:Cytochrome P450 6PZ10 n=1 Tax=Maconellicoccus hirsutus TaxID=177089 RepID=A0AAT9UU19_MACHI